MLRMLAWVGLLSPGGWVNAVLVPLHIVPPGFDWLGGRPVTVVFGLIYGWIPYFIIPLYAALARFDTRYLEASRDLGAGTFGTFLHVTLPLSKQGILAGHRAGRAADVRRLLHQRRCCRASARRRWSER